MATVTVQTINDDSRFTPVALQFSRIFPNTKFSVPIEDIDRCFGKYGHAQEPGTGASAELLGFIWADGAFSFAKHCWEKDREHRATRIYVTTLYGTPVLEIDRIESSDASQLAHTGVSES